MGEDWLRLRLTKAIKDTKEKTELKKRMSASKQKTYNLGFGHCWMLYIGVRWNGEFRNIFRRVSFAIKQQ